MAQISPFYTLQQLVYHTNDNCPQGLRIPALDQKLGRGGKVDCLCCRYLNKMQTKKTAGSRMLRRLVFATLPLS